MVHDLVVACSKFNALHKSIRVNWDRNHKIAVHIFAFRSQFISLRNLDDQIRFPELPFAVPHWERRKIGRITLYRSLRHPTLNSIDLTGIEPAAVRELTVT